MHFCIFFRTLSMQLLHNMPAVASDAIPQLQQTIPPMDTGFTQKQFCLRANIGNCLSADHLINIYALHKMLFVFYAKPQRANLS